MSETNSWYVVRGYGADGKAISALICKFHATNRIERSLTVCTRGPSEDGTVAQFQKSLV
jgi:hypothetical protein